MGVDFHLDRLLHLPYVTVESCHEMSDYVCLKNLRLLNSGIHCPHCQHYTDEIHQDRPILVRDLPIFGRKVDLQVPRRHSCNTWGKYSTGVDFLEPNRRHTHRYEEHIYQRVTCTNIEQVCREEELKYDEIKGIFDYISSQRQKKTGNQ